MSLLKCFLGKTSVVVFHTLEARQAHQVQDDDQATLVLVTKAYEAWESKEFSYAATTQAADVLSLN